MDGIELRSGKLPVETSKEKFGYLRRSEDLLQNPSKSLARLEEDGYLYIPGFHPQAFVESARRDVLQSLSKEGALDCGHDPLSGISKPDLAMHFRPDLGMTTQSIADLVYSDATMAWFEGMFGEPAIHYNFTWLRVIANGQGTWPHCDIVYMGRGTRQLYTMWTPLTTIPLDVGGLMILENSHRLVELQQTYGQLDVDTVCSSDPGKNEVESHGFHGSGAISLNPVQLRNDFGGRWLTSEQYEQGDALIFTMDTVHASLDNQTNLVRLSTDTRYQRASDPADERWVGEAIGHNLDKHETIC
jgi:hypothetical protein